MDLLYCNRCGSVAAPKQVVRRIGVLEVLGYFFWIVPGLIMTLRRHRQGRATCQVCGNGDLIPATAPLAREQLRARADRANAATEARRAKLNTAPTGAGRR